MGGSSGGSSASRRTSALIVGGAVLLAAAATAPRPPPALAAASSAAVAAPVERSGAARTDDPDPSPADGSEGAAGKLAGTPRLARSCARSLFRPIFRSLGSEDSQPRDDGVEVQAQAARRALGVSFGADAQFETIVATVADPIDSGMSYRFDTALEALSRGAEESLRQAPAFYRAQTWLPWDDREAPPADQAAEQRCRFGTPGLLLFRSGKAGAASTFLAVFLVGETPTAGVHVGAMVAALHAARALSPCTRLETAQCPAMRIVGPTFSGAVSSMRTALSTWERDDPGDRGRLRIVTGAANGSGVAPGLTGVPLARHSVEFSSTLALSSSEQCAYLAFLHDVLGVPAAKHRLSGVALLHESGTEFGHIGSSPASDATSGPSGPCDLSPEIDVAFPLHVSSIRDAYEGIDKSRGPGLASLARPTSLDISLREKSAPLDEDSDPSPRTTYAEDVALGATLQAIGAEGVRHVAIMATDVGDAIFLARKIRDVAPDVRLAFFSADALLLHPAFSRDLLGSLVVASYPFLGNDEFTVDSGTAALPYGHRHMVFENSAAEGTFNAVLLARDAGLDELFEYTFAAPKPAPSPPVWTTAVARNGLVPLAVQEVDALHIESDATPPRSWHFVYVLLLLGFLVDHWHRSRTRASLSDVDMPAGEAAPAALVAGSGEATGFRAAPPGADGESTDKAADLAISRTKWEFYAAIRAFVIAVALTYMSAVYALVLAAYTPHSATGVCLLFAPGLALTLCAVVASLASCRAFAKDFVAVRRAARTALKATPAARPRLVSIGGGGGVPAGDLSGYASLIPPRPSRSTVAARWILVATGFAEPSRREDVAFVSYAQLRVLVALTLVATAALTSLLGLGLGTSVWGDHRHARLVLFVLRSVTLAGGVSPLAPAFLAMGCVYAWAASRMARLHDVHTLSRMSPPDGLEDLVSTPIRAVLYPKYQADTPNEGFTRSERALIHSIVRPCTGPLYLALLVANLSLPVILAFLKPPSTLEGEWETVLLFAGCSLGVVLVGATVAQLAQYWWALSNVLRRIIAHPLRSSFSRISPFARRSLDESVSRRPADLMHLVGAAVLFDDLMIAAERPELEELWKNAHGHEPPLDRAELSAQLPGLVDARRDALSSAAGGDVGKASSAIAVLGVRVLAAAHDTMDLLGRVYGGGRAKRRRPRLSDEESARDTKPPPAPTDEVEDALAPVGWRYTPHELKWLRRAEEFVATVVTLLVERHVRQFQHFTYGLTACTLLVLAAFASYSFEPHRLLLTCLWGVTATAVISGTVVFVGLDRNTLLSLIAGTEPGKVTLDSALVLRVVTWVGFPLLGMAAAEYPQVANALGQALGPLLHVLR